MLRICLILWIFLTIVCVLTIKRNPDFVRREKIRLREEQIEKQRSAEGLSPSYQKSNSGAVKEDVITFREGVTSVRFWHMFVILFCGMFYGIYMAAVYKTAAQDVLSDKVLTMAGAFGSACNGTSRIIWATIQDWYGFKSVYICLLVLQCILASTIYAVRSNEVIYPIWVSLSFLCEGGHFSMFPAAAMRIFGLAYGGQIYSIMFFANAFSSIASFLIVFFGGDKVSPRTIFLLSAALTLVNMISLYFFDDTEMKKNSLKKKGLGESQTSSVHDYK